MGGREKKKPVLPRAQEGMNAKDPHQKRSLISAMIGDSLAGASLGWSLTRDKKGLLIRLRLKLD